MKKGIFVTATGTDIGKTYISAQIVKELKKEKINISYFKAALSGAEGEDLIPGDAKFVKDMNNLDATFDEMVCYIFKDAVSPHLAARKENVEIDLDFIKRRFYEELNKYDAILMEGSGGIICPIYFEKDKKIMLEDMIKTLGLSTFVVADAGLGTINHTVITLNYLKDKGIKVNGVILNNYEDTWMQKDNLKCIEEISGTKVIATCAHNGELEKRYDFNWYDLLDEVKEKNWKTIMIWLWRSFKNLTLSTFGTLVLRWRTMKSFLR